MDVPILWMKLCYLHILLLCNIKHSRGVTLQEQLDHITKAKRESLGSGYEILPSRRNGMEYNAILGAPSLASHLPEAEAILPGHTLLRPALGMLKSSIKFPHKDLNDGAGVYGNRDNLGIRYDGKQKRILYSGFRRALSDYVMDFSIVIDDDVEISDRSGDGHPVHDCESDPRFDPIYEIVDEDDNVRYVVQSEKMYEQKIKTETCVKPGKLETSAYLSPYQLREYNLTCFERKIEYWFTVLSLDRTQIETVKIKEGLPICCSCRLTQ